MSPAVAARPDFVARTLARNRLGVAAVVYFVLSAAAPLTVTAGVVPTGYAVSRVTGIPLAFLLVGAVLAVFSVGYVAMARRVANAGAFYAYITHGLGRPPGVGAAWVAVLAYSALQFGLYGAIHAAAGPLLRQWFGWGPAWWLIALCCCAAVGVLGVQRVDVNGTVLAVLLLAEVAVILILDGADLIHPAGGAVSFDALSPANLAQPGAGAILGLAVLGFVGFESAVVFSEESKNPLRTVRVATYTSVAVMAALYALSAWAMTVAVGPDQIVDRSRALGPQMMFTLAEEHLGATTADVARALLATSIVAGMIAFHNTTARYAFALGREHVFPTRLGATSRAGAPRVASLLQTLLGLTVITVYAVAGWDPVVHLFFWGGTAGGYGVLLLVTATSIAVVVYFTRHPSGEPRWRRLAAPVTAAGLLLAVTGVTTAHFDTLLGVAPDSPVRWIIPGGYLTVALLGVGWALILRTKRPHIYTRIGLGARATTIGPPRPTPPGRRPADTSGVRREPTR